MTELNSFVDIFNDQYHFVWAGRANPGSGRHQLRIASRSHHSGNRIGATRHHPLLGATSPSSDANHKITTRTYAAAHLLTVGNENACKRMISRRKGTRGRQVNAMTLIYRKA
jgi:hypothetical protein